VPIRIRAGAAKSLPEAQKSVVVAQDHATHPRGRATVRASRRRCRARLPDCDEEL